MAVILKQEALYILWICRINLRAYNAIQVAESLGISLSEAIDRCLLVRALQ